MKYLLSNIVGFLLVFLISCNTENQNGQNNSNSTNNGLEEQEAFITDYTLSVKEYDETLKIQSNEYLNAFNNGDADIALFYNYPELFKYMQIAFSYEYTIDEIIELLKKNVVETQQNFEDLGISFEIETGKIIRRVELGETILCRVQTKAIAIKGENSEAVEDFIIAISNDNGKNWKFIKHDPEVIRDVLKSKFSEKVIDHLFSL